MTETEYRKSIIKTCLDYRDYLESELKQAYGDGIVGTAEITKMLMEVNDLISEQSRHFMRHSDKLITREELESMLKSELVEIANEQSIEVKSSWTKAQIIDAILGGV